MEQEADRIGIQVLQRAGFDPQAMPSFLEKLLDQARYSTRPPEILLTHPLPESRLADARNRANQMHPGCGAIFLRLLPRQSAYAGGCITPGATSSLATCWSNGLKAMCVSNMRRNMAGPCRRWKRASTDEARKTLQPLLSAEPNNAWYLDLATDIDLGQKRANDAINRLKNAAICALTRYCS
ncbi:Exported zinc metalloprotease YfgC precursor [Salmonella enterica subsp. arizonae]|uniref:Exported zinc metalloprotease YfgC n=1 Tax=Salmonella enterica subsp. arizonae TaxID=59203 RepID=A0A2X4T4B6_SALER|nr:Exported zinc metalloprotease YfgC precursor [Salmonella enterica subsp. arizonae]